MNLVPDGIYCPESRLLRRTLAVLSSVGLLRIALPMLLERGYTERMSRRCCCSWAVLAWSAARRSGMVAHAQLAQ